MRHRVRAAAILMIAALAAGFAPARAQQSGSGYDPDYDYPGQGDDWYGRRDLSRPNRDYAPPLLDQVSIGEDFCLGYEVLFDHLGRGAPLFRTQGRPFDQVFRFSVADPGFPCIGTRPKCDDGDPCTLEAFDTSLLLCVSTPVVDGTACADSVFCNGAETCQGGACAAGIVPDCDDGNACTIDTCDVALDGCQSGPTPLPGEVQKLKASLPPGQPRMILEWVAAPGAEEHNVYRDTSGLLGGLTCYQSALATDTVDGGELPPAGSAFFFLATGRNCAGEGTQGANSAQVERPNDFPCP